MSAELDLDKLRAAREEAEGSGPKHVLFGGEKYEVPLELPLEFAWALTEDRTRDALLVILGDEAFARFMSHGPSTFDLRAFVTRLDELYPGASGEESEVSGKSSPRTTAKPRPTSNASTG